MDQVVMALLEELQQLTSSCWGLTHAATRVALQMRFASIQYFVNTKTAGSILWVVRLSVSFAFVGDVRQYCTVCGHMLQNCAADMIETGLAIC
jgi:hypothetical protein